MTPPLLFCAVKRRAENRVSLDGAYAEQSLGIVTLPSRGEKPQGQGHGKGGAG